MPPPTEGKWMLNLGCFLAETAPRSGGPLPPPGKWRGASPGLSLSVGSRRFCGLVKFL